MTIVIVSYPQDKHAQHVLGALSHKGLESKILNLGEYPRELESAILIGKNVDVGFVGMDDVSGVWWRRPLGAYRTEPSMLEKYISSESEAYVRSLQYYFNKARWVSDPEATRIAGRKPYQLLMAKQVGWRIPDTYIGNSIPAALAFLERNKDVVAKPVSSSFVRLSVDVLDRSSENRVIYAKRVSRAFLTENAERITACPFILQERIKKDLDVRVTVVGDKVFAAGIKGGGGEEVDWRHHLLSREYLPHTLPPDVEDLCRRITSVLGLSFGCIDLGYSNEEGYTFFEINPQGQWLPSEEKLGCRITDALVDLLRS